MRCPGCSDENTRVVDVWVINDGTVIKRRRECRQCLCRWSTAEVPESERERAATRPMAVEFIRGPNGELIKVREAGI